jgi:serine-type D-Ala-D-Ala carboxypeptidase/endopeptidase (penicillin-binding protein 4)
MTAADSPTLAPMPLRARALTVIVAMLALFAAATASAAPPRTESAAEGLTVPNGPDRAFDGGALPRSLERGGSIGRSKLKRKLSRLAGQAPGSSGYYVYDMSAGKKPILFDRAPGHRRKLASNEKMFTTLTAMHRLGPGSRIVTRVKAKKSKRKRRVKGNIYLIGAGDPTFGSGGVNDLARQVRQEGIRRVSGRVVADDSVFDRRRGVPGTGWRASVDLPPLGGLVYGGSTYSGDPAKRAGEEVRDALRRRGVKVGGKVKVGRAPGSLRGSDAIAEFGSPRIKSIVKATNKDSINFYAEMLLKRLWAEPGRRGTTGGGAKAVERFARDLGSDVSARDGSGLTHANKASPRNVVRLLIGAERDAELAKPFYKSLSIAGRDGTLAGRMNGSRAEGRCRGKTGTVHGVSNLSGYCRTKKGLIAFSLLMNGVSSYDYARAIQDRMVAQIARYG